MHIASLYVQKLRSISSTTFTFYPGVNCLIGPNGLGKTTVLEAMHILTVGSSFRGRHLKELVASDARSFFVEGAVASSGLQRTVAVGYDGMRRSVYINGESLLSTSLLFGTILGVCAAPNDCELVFGSPSERRRFIDEQIAQVDPVYVREMKRLQRALLQRNALLRQRSFHGIEAWEEQIAKASSYIYRARCETLAALKPYFTSCFQRLVDGADRLQVDMLYSPYGALLADLVRSGAALAQIEEQSYILIKKLLSDKREMEMKAGATLYGPHRDDFALVWRGRVAVKDQASLGQARAIALALRLSEWMLLSDRSKQGRPLFLIDDLYSFLDAAIIQAFFSIAFELLGQVFITSHSEMPQALQHRISTIVLTPSA